MLNVVLFGAVAGSRIALPILQHPEITLTVFGLDPSRATRHSDYYDLAAEAKESGLPAHYITGINDDSTLGLLRAIAPDVVCVFGWSQLVGKAFRSIPRIGVLGWHPSMLPDNRGRAVIPWTILQRRTETGFTIFWIDEGMDSGDIAAQEIVPVSPRETAASLSAKFVVPTQRALERVRNALLLGESPRIQQDHHRATYCALRTPADGRIDWSQSALDIDCLIRAAGPPYPGAFTLRRNENLTILDSLPVDSTRYWGLAGQVQAIDGTGAVLHCGDRTNILVRTVRTSDGIVHDAAALLRLHERLGVVTESRSGS